MASVFCSSSDPLTNELLLGAERTIILFIQCIFLVVDIFAKDCLELLKAEHAIPSDIVLQDHFVDLLLTDTFSKLLHGQHNVFLCNFARRIRVKLVENRIQARLSEELLTVNGGSQELTIVDQVVVMVVHFVNQLLNLCVAHFDLLSLQHFVELLHSDQSSAVFVDGLELDSQVFDLLICRSFDQHVHRGFLEHGDSFEAAKALEDVDLGS